MSQQVLNRPAALSRIAVAVAALISCALILGCGGMTRTTNVTSAGARTQTTNAPPPAPTKAQYIARADVVCTRYDQQVSSLERREKALTAQFNAAVRGEGEKTAEGEFIPKVVPLWKQLVALYRAGDAQLQVLPVPPGSATTIEKIATANDDIAADMDNLIEAVQQHETLTATHAKEAAQSKAKVRNALEQGYGLKVCGREEP